jgi:glycosyltransferase involved in cell wall biosynthesis
MKNKLRVSLIQLSDFGLGRGLYLSKALSLLGFDVVALTNRPVYASCSPTPTKLSLHSNPKIIEFQIPLAKKLYTSILGRLIVYFYFMLFSFIALLKEKPRPMVLYSRGPQPFTEIVCIFYRIFYPDVKIISDITDLWPDALEHIPMNERIRYLLIAFGHALNKWIYHRINTMVTLNEEMAAILELRFKGPIEIIYGVIDLNEFRPMNKVNALQAFPLKTRAMIEGKFVVLYAGLLGPFQNPLTISKIADDIRNDKDVLFLIVGTGLLKETIQAEIRKKELKNIEFLEIQPPEKMPFLYNLADLCILSYAPIEFLKIGLPKKFIEYAACGKPILCLTPSCVASKLCIKYNAGYHEPNENIASAKRIINNLKNDKFLLKNLEMNSRTMAEDLFSIKSAAKTLEKIMFELDFEVN